MLRERIRTEGPLSVAAYMEACNAHYYATRDPLGAAGDFTTAPEISQMFGEIVGAALADVWTRAGSPSEAAYVELGPGRGTLSADALRVLRRAGFAGPVYLVETSPALRSAQAERVPDARWYDRVERVPGEGPWLCVANEFFDALPVEQFVDGAKRHVILTEDGFAFDRDGEVTESSPAREGVAGALGTRLRESGGAALIIDYGHARSAPGDTLQAVRGHRFSPVLRDPGEQDLTSHVDFQRIAEAAEEAGALADGPAEQGQWLEELGIGARAAALSLRVPDRAADIEAARARLCRPDQMGSLFKVLGLRSPDWPPIAGLR